MTVESKGDEGVLKIKVTGRFDFNVHKEFREATEKVVAGIHKIEVDLSGTDYLDSSALGMLLLLRDKVSGDRNAVAITGAAKDVKKILEIANFDKLFILS
ncbi:MAG: STAS domain-containing protein [Methylomonas sp.]|nr:STAS domain-containing protein [Methylomonas sp.]